MNICEIYEQRIAELEKALEEAGQRIVQLTSIQVNLEGENQHLRDELENMNQEVKHLCDELNRVEPQLFEALKRLEQFEAGAELGMKGLNDLP